MFIKYSGTLAMFFAWVFVVSPTLFAGVDSKKQTITHATCNSKLNKIISLGLILGGFFQLVFSYFLSQKFYLGYNSIGLLLYASTAIISILVAIFSEQSHPKLHLFLAKFYFIANPLSVMFIGLSINNFLLKMFSLFIPAVYYLGLYYLNNKYKIENALMEKWAFLAMSIWTALVTFL